MVTLQVCLPTSKQHWWHSFGQGPWPWDQPLCRGHLRGCRGSSQGVGGGKYGKGQDATQGWKERLETTGGKWGLEKKKAWKGGGRFGSFWNLCEVKKRMLNVLLLDFAFWSGKREVSLLSTRFFNDDFSHLPRLPNYTKKCHWNGIGHHSQTHQSQIPQAFLKLWNHEE